MAAGATRTSSGPSQPASKDAPRKRARQGTLLAIRERDADVRRERRYLLWGNFSEFEKRGLDFERCRTSCACEAMGDWTFRVVAVDYELDRAFGIDVAGQPNAQCDVHLSASGECAFARLQLTTAARALDREFEWSRPGVSQLENSPHQLIRLTVTEVQLVCGEFKLRNRRLRGQSAQNAKYREDYY